MSKDTILVVEDDENILELVSYNLLKEGYRVLKAASGEKGLELAESKLPNLVILDLMLPGINGFDVCRKLKQEAKTRHIPVVMLTAKGEEPDVVAGLEMGADDYMTKPFSPRVLIARVRTILRRKSQAADGDPDAVVKVHDLEINPGRHEVLVKGQAVELTNTEFSILYVLARKKGWVMSRYQIVDAVRGEDYAVTDRAVDVQIVGLRRKLGNRATYIETVRGVGYRFKE